MSEKSPTPLLNFERLHVSKRNFGGAPRSTIATFWHIQNFGGWHPLRGGAPNLKFSNGNPPLVIHCWKGIEKRKLLPQTEGLYLFSFSRYSRSKFITGPFSKNRKSRSKSRKEANKASNFSALQVLSEENRENPCRFTPRVILPPPPPNKELRQTLFLSGGRPVLSRQK
mgnify:FL=1